MLEYIQGIYSYVLETHSLYSTSTCKVPALACKINMQPKQGLNLVEQMLHGWWVIATYMFSYFLL